MKTEDLVKLASALESIGYSIVKFTEERHRADAEPTGVVILEIEHDK